jgi:hypothetical protein
VQCCEHCGLANNRDVNAATNILLALQSLVTTCERHVDLQRPNYEDSEDKDEDDGDASDYSSDDSDSNGQGTWEFAIAKSIVQMLADSVYDDGT